MPRIRWANPLHLQHFLVGALELTAFNSTPPPDICGLVASLVLINSLAMVRKALSTLVAVLADVSRKEMPNLSAKLCAVSFVTYATQIQEVSQSAS